VVQVIAAILKFDFAAPASPPGRLAFLEPMQLPSIAPGKRYTLPRPIGSADALLLARLAEARRAEKRLLAIVTAEPADAQRLADELPFFAPGLRTTVFPDWETLPYDTFSPHQDLISERLATLWRIHSREADVVLLPATTALTRLAPPSFLAGTTFQFQQKTRLDEAALKAQLTLAGYNHVSQVVSPGEYAVRGGLIDLFPMGSPVPYRVDLFDNEVDSIRTFDPDSQRSLYPVPEVRLLPGREFPMDEAARTVFRQRWREKLDGDPTKSRIYKDIAQGIATAGIEYYLPLFFEQTATIFDYLGPEAMLVLHGEVDQALERFWTDTRDRHRFLSADPDRPILPPEDIFQRGEEFFGNANRQATLALRGSDPVDWARPLADVAVAPPSRWPCWASTWTPRRTGCCWSPKATAAARACWNCCATTRSTRPAWPRWPSSRPATRRWPSPRRRSRSASSGMNPLKLEATASPPVAGPSSSSPRPSCSPAPRRRGAGASRSRPAASTR
jgi:transcription-repair coupling factor (superfamily II helicase)